MLNKALIFLIILLFSSSAYALNNIYLDGIGAFTHATEFENPYGGGFGFAYNLLPGINIFNKNVFNTVKKKQYNKDTKENYTDRYSFVMNLAGVEYNYNIDNMPLYIQAAFSGGAGQAKAKVKHIEENDTGFCMLLTFGFNYVITQHLSVFLNAGYHKTYFFDEFKSKNLMGGQITAGFRITLWGMNKELYSGY